MMTVVDSHTHLLPAPVATRVRALFETYGPGEVLYPIDEAELLAELAVDGVDVAWSLPYAHRPGVATWMNEETAALRDRRVNGSVRLVAGATVHPGDDDPGGMVEDAVQRLGARVLKLHCAVGRFGLGDTRLEPVWKVAAMRRLPVVIHAGHEPLGHTRNAHLHGLSHLAERHPELPIIVAHLGYPAIQAVLERMERYDNLHADLTPVVVEPVDVDPSDLRRFSGRLLFGSDAPNTGVRVTALLDRLQRAGLQGEQFRAIVGGNAARLVAGVRGS